MCIVVKTIDGRQYRYSQTSRREGGKVKTKSVYLGPVTPRRKPREPNPDAASWGIIGSQLTKTHGIDWEAIGKQQLERMQVEEAQQKAFADKMHALYGMKLTTTSGPVEKSPASIDLAQQGEQSPSDSGQTDSAVE